MTCLFSILMLPMYNCATVQLRCTCAYIKVCHSDICSRPGSVKVYRGSSSVKQSLEFLKLNCINLQFKMFFQSNYKMLCTNSSCLVNITPMLTHRYMVEGDVSDVIVGAALPRVIEPEAKGAGVPSIKSCVLPKSAILHVDGPIVDLHASDGKITAGKKKHTHTYTYTPIH